MLAMSKPNMEIKYLKIGNSSTNVCNTPQPLKELLIKNSKL
jgi:hypothetical protein